MASYLISSLKTFINQSTGLQNFSEINIYKALKKNTNFLKRKSSYARSETKGSIQHFRNVNKKKGGPA